MFNGITGGHTRWHLLRAVYEGVAFGIRDCLDSIPTRVDTVRMAGGGANSPVWAQIFADVLGRRIVVPAGSEFGAKGAAIVAEVGLGVFESYEAGVDATVEIVREYEPDRSKTDVYDDFSGIYRELREATINSWDKCRRRPAARRPSELLHPAARPSAHRRPGPRAFRRHPARRAGSATPRRPAGLCATLPRCRRSTTRGSCGGAWRPPPSLGSRPCGSTVAPGSSP